MKQKILLSLGVVFILAFAGYWAYQAFKVDIPELSDYQKAVSLIQQGKWEEAQPLLEKCIHSEPGNGECEFHLGNVYRKRSNFSDALTHYENAINKTPNIKEAYNNAAAIKMTEGKYDDALLIINHGLGQDANNQELLFKKAQLIYFNADYKQTIEIMSRLVVENQYFEAYRFMGLSYLKLGNKVKGLDNLKIYLEMAPSTVKDKNDIERIVLELEVS
ncbi:hypothetical protein PAESOLCIP111_03474 [Paenibacillus solanacearum]|uniref:Tetratricopeptide repeat protein n=1 Tax=Paenibacillus solanacearum TaxID=2048548 RepID=A0A916K2K9_9BACL|nr:tetratricopeptide repeat protein [Paenibacillus solanacearum]CAG7633522.1 hypothetical protein PAESOLCIP111_03474 [Paenibacillus solanacearum]